MIISNWRLLAFGSIFLVSCLNHQNTALQQLEQNQYEFSADDFLRAASTGDIPILILFGKAGINVNELDENNRTALMAASNSGQHKVVQLLLGAGADPLMVDVQGQDALMMASANGYTDIARMLLSRGASPDLQTNRGNTALTIAIIRGHSDVVGLLAGLTPQDQLNEALLIASSEGNGEIVAHLLSHGASVDTKDPSDQTPLMIAAQNGKFDIVKVLLAKKAGVAKFTDEKAAANLAKPPALPM